MYRVVIRISGRNPVTKRAQYRVVDTFKAPSIDSGKRVVYFDKHLSILISAPHKINTFINPCKALKI